MDGLREAVDDRGVVAADAAGEGVQVRSITGVDERQSAGPPTARRPKRAVSPKYCSPYRSSANTGGETPPRTVQ